MKQDQEQILDDARCEGLRRVLVGQYMFHEARHHTKRFDDTFEIVPTALKAHTVADVYKCLHQGEFGVGHSIEDPSSFTHNLAEELARAETNSEEPVLEDVSPNSSVFRVNLGPYLRILAGRKQDAADLLAETCVNSAAVHKGSPENFIASLYGFRRLNREGKLVVQSRSYMFPNELVELFLVQVDDFIKVSGNIPVLSHSPIYRNYNAPSYRVVDRATLERSNLAFLFEELQ
jgi:hypothetical protein